MTPHGLNHTPTSLPGPFWATDCNPLCSRSDRQSKR